LDARSRDLTAYRLYRTRTVGRPIAEYSFRVEASALRQFYAWAVETDRLDSGPVKPLSRNGRDNLSTNRIRHSKIRHVDDFLREQFLRTASEVSADSSIRSAAGRNVAAIKTLLSTGLRLQELASLLTLDIDHGVGMRRAICVEMESITKYGINRTAAVPFYAIDAIRRYRKTERPNVVYRHQRALKTHMDRCFVISSFDESTRLVSGMWQGRSRQFPLHQVPIQLRLNAVAIKADGSVEPLCLFLGDSRGLGMTRSGWEGVFSEISEDMIRQRPDDNRIRKVTPHDLRAHLRHHEPDRRGALHEGVQRLGHSSFVLTRSTYADYIREDELVAPKVGRGKQ
jgi:integrase